MGLQKQLLEHLSDFSENRISEQMLNSYLLNVLPSIWAHGLSEENITRCLKTFLANNKIGRSTRRSVLQCLVPRQKLSKRAVNQLLLWLFSNLGDPAEAGLVLHWLSVMIPNCLISTEPVEQLFNQLLMCLFVDKLTGPTCDALLNLVKPGLVTPRSVYVVQHYCNLDVNVKDKGKVLHLQRLFYACCPSLYNKPPVKASSYTLPKDKFSKSMSQFAFQNMFLKALPVHLMPSSRKSASLSNSSTIETPSNPFSEITGMKELGLRMGRKEISLVDINSALNCKEGLIYLCWHQSMGWPFPNDARLSDLKLLDKLLNICQRIKSGLNFIPSMMPGILLSWDGEENHEVIYELISWMHFETFEDLYKNVLYYIVNLYLTGTVMDKVKIIYCLTKLISNKVTTSPREVTVLMISLTSNLIKIGLCSTALQSSMLLMASVRFYKYLSYIEEQYMLGTWTIAPPFVVMGSVFSDCFVLISEICSLVVRYNTVMCNKFTSLGLIDKFEEEEEIAKTYLKDLYLFFWEGQASKTELMMSEVNEAFINNLPAGFDSVFSVRNHCGITPLVAFLAQQLTKDPWGKNLTDEDLMKMFMGYCEGLFLLKNTFLTDNVDSRMELE